MLPKIWLKQDPPVCHKFSSVFDSDKRKACQYVHEIYQSVVNVCQGDMSSSVGLLTHFSISTIEIA